MHFSASNHAQQRCHSVGRDIILVSYITTPSYTCTRERLRLRQKRATLFSPLLVTWLQPRSSNDSSFGHWLHMSDRSRSSSVYAFCRVKLFRRSPKLCASSTRPSMLLRFSQSSRTTMSIGQLFFNSSTTSSLRALHSGMSNSRR